MPSVETEIWLALKSRILTLPFVPILQTAYPGSTFTPGSTPYIAVGRVNLAPRRVLVGKGQHERNGTLILSYVASIGQDLAVYEEVAGKIAAHFEEDTRMKYGGTCVRITEKPHVVEGFRDEGWWRTPVNIPWQTHR